MCVCVWCVCRYDHIKLSSRGGGAGVVTVASENHAGAGGGGNGGGGGAAASGVGGGAPVRGGAKKPLVLRDRGECGGGGAAGVGVQPQVYLTPSSSSSPAAATVDSMFRPPADGQGSEVAAAAASPNTYVDAIRTGLSANATEQSETSCLFCALCDDVEGAWPHHQV